MNAPMKLAFFALFMAALRAGAHPGSGIAVDEQGRVFFTAGPMVVMKFYQLHHIQRAPDGGLITASDMGDAIWRFTVEGKLSRFYPPTNEDRAVRVGFGGDPFAVDKRGDIYTVNSKQGRYTQILRISSDGRVHVLAGSDWGFADGKGEAARFGELHSGSMLCAENGVLLVTDSSKRIRSIAPDGEVTTLAGGQEAGYVDGPAALARFDSACGLAMDRQGDVLVVEYGEPGERAGRIRRISRDGMVTTWAGSKNTGRRDGPLLEATFDGPTGIASAVNGDVFVLEPDGPRVRKISLDAALRIELDRPPPLLHSAIMRRKKRLGESAKEVAPSCNSCWVSCSVSTSQFCKSVEDWIRKGS